jgi:hypothetical protein
VPASRAATVPDAGPGAAPRAGSGWTRDGYTTAAPRDWPPVAGAPWAAGSTDAGVFRKSPFIPLSRPRWSRMLGKCAGERAVKSAILASVLTLGGCLIATGCGRGDNVALNSPVLLAADSVSVIQFETRQPGRFNIDFGVGIKTCAGGGSAATEAGQRFGQPLDGSARPPCKFIAPKLGAIDWVIAADGVEVAHGTTVEFADECVPASESSKLYWRGVGTLQSFSAQRYVISLRARQASKPESPLSFRLRVIAPLVWP